MYAIVFNKLVNGTSFDPFRRQVFYDNIAKAVTRLENNGSVVRASGIIWPPQYTRSVQTAIGPTTDWTDEEIEEYSFGLLGDAADDSSSTTTAQSQNAQRTTNVATSTLTEKQLESLPVTRWCVVLLHTEYAHTHNTLLPPAQVPLRYQPSSKPGLLRQLVCADSNQ